MEFTKGRIIGLVGGIMIVLATVLPWVGGLGAGGISLDVMGMLTGFGTIVLVIGIIGLVLALLGRGVGTIVCGVLSLLITLFWFGVWSWISTVWVAAGGTSSVGYGTYIAIIGAILAIVGGAMMIGEKKKAKTAAAPAVPAAPPSA